MQYFSYGCRCLPSSPDIQNNGLNQTEPGPHDEGGGDPHMQLLQDYVARIQAILSGKELVAGDLQQLHILEQYLKSGGRQFWTTAEQPDSI